jgi:hypothetical protein
VLTDNCCSKDRMKQHQFGLKMPGRKLLCALWSRARSSCVQYSQYLIKISVVKCTSSAVNEKKFNYPITEEPISRILKTKIQETEVRLESNCSLSRAPPFAHHGMGSVTYMYIFHFCGSNVHPSVNKVLHKVDIIDV